MQTYRTLIVVASSLLVLAGCGSSRKVDVEYEPVMGGLGGAIVKVVDHDKQTVSLFYAGNFENVPPLTADKTTQLPLFMRFRIPSELKDSLAVEFGAALGNVNHAALPSASNADSKFEGATTSNSQASEGQDTKVKERIIEVTKEIESLKPLN